MSRPEAAAPPRRCGFAAIVGRPNVGKSTLLNHLLRRKVSITSRRPQTTRHRIVGVRTEGSRQCLFVDTPGLDARPGRALNRIMNQTARSAAADVDVVLLVTERLVFNDADRAALAALEGARSPLMLVINKVDRIADRERLLPHIEKMSRLRPFAEIVPVSALRGHNLDVLAGLVMDRLPAGEFLFPPERLTDRDARFQAAELVREKLTRQLGDELPYDATVEIESWRRRGAVLHIRGLILVNRPGQKRILIGRDGRRLKRIGESARREMERAFGSGVMLSLWVKTRSGWADDDRALRSLGYTEG